MTRVNHDQVFIVIAGMLFIAGFVYVMAASGNLNNMPTGAVTGVTWVSCIDSEFPPSGYQQGTINVTYVNETTGEEVRIMLTDSCSTNKIVEEYACKGITPVRYYITCPGASQCKEGMCTASYAVYKKCQDKMDNGRKIYEFGITNGTDPSTGNFVTYIDSCVADSNDLMEGYCINNVPRNERITCEYGCDGANGKCNSPPPPTPFCTDTDYGANVSEFGTTFNNTVSKGDVCLSDSTIREWTCSEGGAFPAETVMSQQMQCPAGQYCDVGRCGTEPFTYDFCFDTDAGELTEYGIAWYNGETHPDTCVNANTITEWYCNGYYLYSRNVACPNGMICSAGECIEGDGPLGGGNSGGNSGIGTEYASSETKTSIQEGDQQAYMPGPPGATVLCFDSDGGLNYVLKGTITMNQSQVFTDYCASNTVIFEGRCTNSSWTMINKSCTDFGYNYSCSNGACAVSGSNSSNVSCFDSDGGLNVMIYGIASNGSSVKQDVCLNGGAINEGICVGNNALYSALGCPSGTNCSNGVCVMSSSNSSNVSEQQQSYAPSRGGSMTYAGSSGTGGSIASTGRCVCPGSSYGHCGEHVTKSDCESSTCSGSSNSGNTDLCSWSTNTAVSSPGGSGGATTGTLALVCSCDSGGRSCPWSSCTKEGAGCECCRGTCPGVGCDILGTGSCKKSVVYTS